MPADSERRFQRAPTPLPPPPWRAIEAIPVFLIALVAGALLSSAALVFHSCGAQRAVEALAGEAALGLAVVAWVRTVHKAPLVLLGAPIRPVGDIGVGIAGGAAILVAGWAVLALVTAIVTSIAGHAPTQPEQVDLCVRGSSLLAFAPVVVLAAPVGEELFFRGFLYRALRARYPVWSSTLVSSALFGLAHYQGVDYFLIIPALFVVGVGLALLFEYRQSVVATMAAHATFNLYGFIRIVMSRH